MIMKYEDYEWRRWLDGGGGKDDDDNNMLIIAVWTTTVVTADRKCILYKDRAGGR